MKNGYFDSPLDYAALMRHVESLCERYPSISLSYVGNSLLSRRIPMLHIGERGGREVFYVAGHHASEWLCTGVLLSFAEELCRQAQEGGRLWGYSVEYLCRARRITILPQLNVDGTDIAINGISPDCPLHDRLERAAADGGFSRWQANARGVDLNHNYNAGFYEYKRIEAEAGIYGASPTRYSGEYPESEPECSALANYLRCTTPALVISLHSQGEVIYGSESGARGAREIGQRLSAACGYPLATPEGAAAYGGLCDWYSAEMGLPSFTFECGIGENPLPLSAGDGIYSRIRTALFSALYLV